MTEYDPGHSQAHGPAEPVQHQAGPDRGQLRRASDQAFAERQAKPPRAPAPSVACDLRLVWRVMSCAGRLQEETKRRNLRVLCGMKTTPCFRSFPVRFPYFEGF